MQCLVFCFELLAIEPSRSVGGLSEFTVVNILCSLVTVANNFCCPIEFTFFQTSPY